MGFNNDIEAGDVSVDGVTMVEVRRCWGGLADELARVVLPQLLLAVVQRTSHFTRSIQQEAAESRNCDDKWTLIRRGRNMDSTNVESRKYCQTDSHF